MPAMAMAVSAKTVARYMRIALAWSMALWLYSQMTSTVLHKTVSGGKHDSLALCSLLLR